MRRLVPRIPVPESRPPGVNDDPVSQRARVDGEQVRRHATAPPPTWEYKVVNTGWMRNAIGSALEDTLNRLGRDGWELTGVVDGPATAVPRKEVTQYLFKRQRR